MKYVLCIIRVTRKISHSYTQSTEVRSSSYSVTLSMYVHVLAQVPARGAAYLQVGVLELN